MSVCTNIEALPDRIFTIILRVKTQGCKNTWEAKVRYPVEENSQRPSQAQLEEGTPGISPAAALLAHAH